jgi:hypothetical protein
MSIRLQALEEKIRKIKDQIAALGDLRPGALSEQYNVCGNPRCRCKADPPLKHGPYHQLSFTLNGKSTTQFVRKGDVSEVRKQVRNYQRLRQLVDRWIMLAMELSRLRLKDEQQSTSGTARTSGKSRKIAPE